MRAKRTEAEIQQWKDIWYNARRNMPKRHAKNTGWAMLGLLLFGKRRLHMKVYSLSYDGRPPKEEKQQDVLRMLGGPYGKVFARAIMQKRGLDPSKFIWH